MADLGKDQERHCHDLLIKLKKTTESLLANQSAQGPWGTYGALRRVCDDAEAILNHRLINKKASSETSGGFWPFIQGLKWLSPNIASVIEKINRLKLSHTIDSTDDGRAWLRESVQDHSFITQLDILTFDMDYLRCHYYNDAFLCQASYREAMRLCFKAIELNKPALLAEISPQLLKSGQVEYPNTDSKTEPGTRYQLRRTQSDWNTTDSIMGNKNSHLNVHYSSHLSCSNMSLAVDPSLGGSSLLQQKIISGPCFVSSLDSPGLLENLGTHPITDAMRNIQCSNNIHHFSQQPEHIQKRQSVPSLRQQQNVSLRPSSLSRTSQSVLIHDPGIKPENYVCENNKSSEIKNNDPQSNLQRNDSLSSFEDISNEADFLLRQKSDSLKMDMEDFTPELRNSHFSALTMLESSFPRADTSYKASSHIDIQITSLPHKNSISSGSSLGLGNASQRSESYHSQQESFINNGSHVSLGTDTLDCPNLRESPSCDKCSEGFKDSINSDVLDPKSRQSMGKQSPNKKLCVSNSDLTFGGGDTFSSIDKKLSFLVKSDPALNNQDPPIDNGIPLMSSWRNEPSSPRPWSEQDLYNLTSPGTSPVVRSLRGASQASQSSGNVYIPQGLLSATPTDGSSTTSAHSIEKEAALNDVSNNSLMDKAKYFPSTSDASLHKKMGHKRWVSDTSAITIEGQSSEKTSRAGPQSSSVSNSNYVKAAARLAHQANGCKASGWETESYQSALTKPTEGQSLISYLTSQDFNTCANLEKENAHFHISEALIAAFESMKWNRMMQKQASGRKSSSSSSSSDEEIHALRQRIRIRKREKFLEKSQPFPSVSDGVPDAVTTSQSASSPANSSQDVSSMSEECNEDEEDGQDIDLPMSCDGQSNLAQLRSSGLTLSMASLYSDAELARSNKQIVKINAVEESLNPGSAEYIAISLLKKFSEKHLPKASELEWLVNEVDVPQSLLPLPASIPISPDDADNGDLATPNKTRLRGNMEWAPPRQQIIFSIHTPEKRETVMSRQNYRCAGCGKKIDRAFMKRCRYCVYLGKYFCPCCHSSELSVIPGYVLERWDFTRYPISTFSQSLLEKIWSEPLFHLETINPILYKRVRVLESIKESRQQLVHLHSLLVVCKRDPKVLKEMQALPSHWLSNDDSYSMADFMEVKSGTMLQRIRIFINLAVNHIRDCQLCQGLGFLCGMCQDKKVIFPFQLESVVTCQVCQSCYHRDCFVPEKCPKCIRREAS
ncbi:run domain Beclin-1-interacting and cysteine-rich domain-containing protein-like isoform X2 [Biomphalaria glabrata]|uniref:Run domain Beclin-1-interacting and cysteine-rich domain-containing protein-like isoform X2 n=1 Tax=Biomphalaria glabrata TaxID=6526 RepID=A0A9U8DZI6_BIOGL|nr:run domain Beclin-1-interacting and cysteine-rich domain-containing protein-like isoform X2 [Biomphalaria glabrata]